MLQELLAALPDQLAFPFPRDEYLPPSMDRNFWENLPAPQREKLIREGEEARMADFPALPASLYREFYRNGNRVNFEKPYFARRIILFRQVKGYCAEPREELLDRIIDVMDSLCGEWTWVLPAHNWPLDNPFPPAEPPRVDLFAANTSSLLALTLHLLGEPLEREAACLIDRVKGECRRRCLEPYRENDNHWWMGYIDDPNHGELNNWNPWITDNYLHTLFLLEDDEDTLRTGVKRAGEILTHYLDVLPGDGGCDEGPSYWDHAAGTLYDCLDILHWAGGRKTTLPQDPFLRKAASYIASVHIGGDYFVNFADCVGRIDHLPPGLIFRMGETLGEPRLKDLSLALGHLPRVTAQEEAFTTPRRVRDLQVRSENYSPSDRKKPEEEIFPELQIALRRGDNYTFACKGGHNGESHNHNDVGQFILYGQKAPLLIDPGVGDYTRETFSDKRYTIWTMQSLWHNLPEINGWGQSPGHEHKASLFEKGKGGYTVGMEMAYPAEAGITQWLRSFAYTDEGIILKDVWELSREGGSITWNFLSLDEPQFTPESFTLSNPAGETLACRYDGRDLSGDKEYKAFPPDDGKMNEWKRKGLWRTRLSLKSSAPLKGESFFTFMIKSNS